VGTPWPAPDKITLYDIVKLIEGDHLELAGNAEGQSGKRVQQVWREIRAALKLDTKSYHARYAGAARPGRDVLH